MPPSITAEQAKGFTVGAEDRAVGAGDELLDLADTNVWRRIFH
jgi:pyruvate dehydrogenase (quinone)